MQWRYKKQLAQNASDASSARGFEPLPDDLPSSALRAPSPGGRRERCGTLRDAHTPYTFNNRNSRSHELITRKKVSYSFRFTEI
ncbi:hypothetical protein GGR67_001942 [Xanthomonas arboricola]|nr:hypothetical protein [Xanthomonas euroxanthea]